MGREANATLDFRGATGPGKLLLESDELILRGAVKARIPRGDIHGFSVNADDLLIETASGPLRATLGPKEAAAWVKALAKPVPGLADKLDVGIATPVRLLAPLHDPALIFAVQGCTAAAAAVLLGEIEDAAELDAALAALADKTITAFWAVTVKGKASPLPEALLRARLRDAGFIDTKSCKVSETRSATRFQRR